MRLLTFRTEKLPGESRMFTPWLTGNLAPFEHWLLGIFIPLIYHCEITFAAISEIPVVNKLYRIPFLTSCNTRSILCHTKNTNSDTIICRYFYHSTD